MQIASITTDQDFVDYVLSLAKPLRLPEKPPVSHTVEALKGSHANRLRRVSLVFDQSEPRCFVVKHAPAGGSFEGFPEVRFPEDRLDYEVSWYKRYGAVAEPLLMRPPKIFHYSAMSRAIVMEDLGKGPTLAWLLTSKDRHEQLLEALGQSIGTAHTIPCESVPHNPAAELNRPLVFTLAVSDPEILRLMPELERMERSFKESRFLVLTHGDLQPESILQLSDGRFGILDAELADPGAASFDLGTMAAHVLACRLAGGNDEEAIIDSIWHLWNGYWSTVYRRHPQWSRKELATDVIQHCGAELLRRSLGPVGFDAQLDAELRQRILAHAINFIAQPADTDLFEALMTT